MYISALSSPFFVILILNCYTVACKEKDDIQAAANKEVLRLKKKKEILFQFEHPPDQTGKCAFMHVKRKKAPAHTQKFH